MMNSFQLFLKRCARITIAPGQEAAQIVLNRCRLGGWILNWLATAFSTYWIGEVLWPSWNFIIGILAVALVTAFPLMLIESVVFHLIGRALGGSGRWDILVALFGYSAVPGSVLALILGGAIAGYVRIFGSIRFHLAFIFLFLLALLVAVITGLVILRHGLGANYRLSARRAWLMIIAGSLVLLLGESVLRAPYIAKRPIPVDNIIAMMELPAPPMVTVGDAAKHWGFEYTANLQYYRKLPIQRGDVLIYRDRNEHYRMGRILGLPGELAGLENGHLVVNGLRFVESWPTGGDLTIPPRLIGSDEYFACTDKRSADPAAGSRFHEIVKRDQILGPVLKINIALLRLLFGQP
jgi:hypothetical protein